MIHPTEDLLPLHLRFADGGKANLKFAG